MTLKLKNTVLISIIISGFLIFIINLNNLNFSNNSNYLNTNKLNSSKNEKNQKSENEINYLSIENPKSENEINYLSIENPITEKKINYTEKTVIVEKGQIFSIILDSFNFGNIKKFEIINSVNKIFDLRELKVNQKIIFLENENKIVKKIIFEQDFKTDLIINLDSEITITKKSLEIYNEIESKEYTILNSLYADGKKNNVPNQILIKLIQLFSFDLDFQRDIKKNTIVSISYEKSFVDKKSEYYFGDIQYAQIKIKNNTLEYFKFITDDGFTDYFNREGKNVKKSILKTPLDGARLSSSFGMRKHPISGFNKMHKGIDFAAPEGTPVYAGGNGVIERIGVNGGYGKYILIRHNNEYKTAYAHLSGFKKNIAKGTRVNQGEIIGYVGSTGLSTGPHLHYEIIYQNKQINPLTLKLPSGKILQGNELKRFEKNYKRILADHLNNLFE